MSKIKLEVPFQQFRGKVCKHSQIIFKQMYGTKFTSQICNPRTKPFTADEQARQTKFKTAHTNALAILADPQQKATAEERFYAQKGQKGAYKTLTGMLVAEEYAKL